MTRIRRVLLLAILGAIFVPETVRAYDRNAAVNYASTWYNTDLDGDGYVDHVNTPSYTWYYHQKIRLFNLFVYDTKITRSNNGGNAVLAADGFDCTNFASQILKAGGIGISGPGVGGTIIGVRRLAAALPQISEVTTLGSPGAALPANIAPGDVVEWLDLHMTVVVSTNPVLLSFHSNDNFGFPMTGFGPQAYPATVFHIVGSQLTLGDQTPPTVVINDANGNVVNDGGLVSGKNIAVTVNSANGVQALEVTKGAPLIDRLQDYLAGTGTFIFQDQAAHGTSYTYKVDLSALTGGDVAFVQAFDGHGNPTLVSFAISPGPTPVAPPNPPLPQPPYPQPNPSPGSPIAANTGQNGVVCSADPNNGISNISFTDGGITLSYPYTPASKGTVCFPWACTRVGTYDMTAQFQNSLGTNGPPQTIHCANATPVCRVFQNGAYNAPTDCGPTQFDLLHATLEARTGEALNFGGDPLACTMAERILTGKCNVFGFSTGGINYSTAATPARSMAINLFYQPPVGKRINDGQPFTLTVGLNGGGIFSQQYPTHGTYSAYVEIPVIGQPQSTCSPSGTVCLNSSAASSGGGSGGGGPPGSPGNPAPAPPPTPTSTPFSQPAQTAAAAQHLYPLTSMFSTGFDILSPGGYAVTMTAPPPVPGLDLTKVKLCMATDAGLWSCLAQAQSAAAVSCANGQCVYSANVVHLSTWAFFTDLPASLPDSTPIALTDVQISQDGAIWQSPNGGTVFASSVAYARVTGRDPSNSVQVVSGVVASTIPVPATAEAATQILLHFDEGTGNQAFDSSGHAVSTAQMQGSQQSWAPGRFGSALNFSGVGQYLTLVPFSPTYDAFGTVSVWVNLSPAAPYGGGGILSKTGVGLSIVNGHARADLAGLPNVSLIDNGTITPGVWTQIVVTYDGQTARLFVNGALKASAPLIPYGSQDTANIGYQRGNPTLWNGLIDEVKFLSRPESVEEVALDYRRGSAVLYTTDNGASWSMAPSIDYGGAVDGQPGPFTLTGTGMQLARSTYTNHAEFVVRDAAGNISSATVDLPVQTPDVTPPQFSQVQISSAASWYPYGAVLPSGPGALRLTVTDPTLTYALNSGLQTSTEPAPASRVPGTIGLWHLDEGGGSSAADSGPYALTLSINPADWTTGRFGAGLTFNSDWWANAPGFNTGPQWTASMWVKERDFSNGYLLMKFYDPRQGFAFGFSNDTPYVLVGSAAQTYLMAPAPLVKNVWHYLAATYDGTTARFYIDGVLAARQAGGYSPDGAGMMLGGSLRGSLDEVRVLNYAVSDAQIASEYRSGYGALFSSDGGQTWSMAAVDYGGAVAGALTAQLTATGFTLAASTSSNLLSVYAADVAGNVSRATYVLPAGQDASVPGAPVFVSTAVTGGAARLAWLDTSTEPAAAFLVYRATASGAGISGLTPVQVTTSTTAFDSPGTPQDSYYYAIAARSAQGNVGPASAWIQVTFRVAPVDAMPPRTTLTIGSPRFGSAPVDISSATPITLTAVDDKLTVGDGAGLGVARTLYAVDSGSFTVYAASFTLAVEGLHAVSFYSVDVVGNAEVVHVSSIAVDATPPSVALQVFGSSFTDAAGNLDVSTLTALGFYSSDLVVNGVASGVRSTQYQVNNGSFAVYGGTFSFAAPDGPRLIAFQATDNVGNASLPKSATVFLDSTPPLTTFALAGGRQYQGPGGYYSSADARVVLVANDPLTGGGASGVAFTRGQDNGGPSQAYTSSFTLSEGLHALGFQSQDNVGNLEVLRSTMVLIDATPPISAATIGAPAFTGFDGTIYVATTTPVSFTAADPTLSSSTIAGSGVNRIEVAVDSAPFVAYSAALTFTEGRHAILYRAIDNVGNIESAHLLTLSADATPPLSTFVIGQPQFALSTSAVLVSSLTPLGVTAVDPVSNGVASGVRQSFDSINGAPFTVFAASFALAAPDGSYAVSFYSQDNVLNTEAAKTAALVLDATPPAVALLSPGACAGEVCRVVKGKFPVLGSATDLHFAGFVLDFAPGQNATTGYALISSGTVAVSSASLGTWDASALSGWQTLRLTATDLVANVSVIAVNVFVGDPGELMILGNHDVFDLPQGVAADSSGNIYVADTDADRIAVFSATGTFLAAFGGHGDHDDHVSTATLRLNKPKGVTVDAAGNVYVADTNDDRVLKLSATGQILLSVGRREKGDKDRDRGFEFRPGKKLGEFNKPSGVAVDARGNIYVADTANNRVQVLSSTGAALIAFRLPPLPASYDDEREGHDADDQALGRPFGIAVDASGKIYVADAAGGRALVYGATGQLLLTLPIAGTDKAGRAVPGRPEGVAVSTDGYCLLVSDRRFGRVLKFDNLGDQTLAFGALGKIGAGKSGIVFLKPAGLALSADGTLLVADRNNDRIERFGLPTGKTLVVPPFSRDDDDLTAKDVLDRDSGGKVERRDHASVSVPAGALPDDLKITVSTMSAANAAAADAMGRVAEAKGLVPAYAPVEYGPEGTKFNAPVTLVQPYDPRLLAAAGVAEDSLQIHYWDKDKGDWEALASTVDKGAHTVTAKTPHFSLYQVLGSTGAALSPAAADATFGLKAAYAFPNPVHAGGVTIRIQPGLADSVSVRVYDVSGRKVHDSSSFTLNQSLDDGNGLGAQYTYDHIWDVSGVGSGVYTYVITATKAGNADVHKTGRIGVAK